MANPTANNAAASKPGVAGGVFYAPLGTALPTDASTDLDGAFVGLGYVSDAGITPSRDVSVEQIKAWGGDVVAALVTDDAKSFEFTLLEVFAEAVQKFVHGEDNVVVTPAVPGTSGQQIAIMDKAFKVEDSVLVFEMRHDGKKRRVVVANADSNVSGEEPYTDGALSAYTISVTALKDDTGTRVYEFLEDVTPAAGD